MSHFEEGFLAFEFGERWHVFKFDEHYDYRERMEKLDETKAVDFAGILDGRELHLVVGARFTFAFSTTTKSISFGSGQCIQTEAYLAHQSDSCLRRQQTKLV